MVVQSVGAGMGSSQPSAPIPDVDTNISSPEIPEGNNVDPISIEMSSSRSAEVDPPTVTEIVITAQPPLTMDLSVLVDNYFKGYWAAKEELEAINRALTNSAIAGKYLQSARDFANVANIVGSVPALLACGGAVGVCGSMARGLGVTAGFNQIAGLSQSPESLLTGAMLGGLSRPAVNWLAHGSVAGGRVWGVNADTLTTGTSFMLPW